MEIRKKTITFEYRYFKSGEVVTGSLEPPSKINNRERYTVDGYIEPSESSASGTVLIRGMSEPFPDWMFEPLTEAEKA